MTTSMRFEAIPLGLAPPKCRGVNSVVDLVAVGVHLFPSFVCMKCVIENHHFFTMAKMASKQSIFWVERLNIETDVALVLKISNRRLLNTLDVPQNGNPLRTQRGIGRYSQHLTSPTTSKRASPKFHPGRTLVDLASRPTRPSIKSTLWILRLPNFRGLLDESLDSVTFSIENVHRYFQRSTECIICMDSVKKVTEILI